MTKRPTKTSSGKAAPKPRTSRKRQPRLNPVRQGSAPHGLNATAEDLVAAMVWDGLARRDAARKLGISEDYAYRLLRDPEVLAKLRTETEALRLSGRARAIHRLEEIAEQDDNLTAAVGAIKAHQALDDRAPGAAGTSLNVNVTAGYVIDCSAAFSRGRQALPGAVPAGYAIDTSKYDGTNRELVRADEEGEA